MYNPEFSISELFSKSAKIYKDNIGLIVIITLIAFTPVFILRLFMPAGYAQAFLQYQQLLSQFGAENVSIFDTPGAVIFNFIILAVDSVFMPISVAAITYITARAIRKIKPNMGEMFAFSIGKILKLLATTLILIAIVAVVSVLILLLASFLPIFLINILLIVVILMVVKVVFIHNIAADTKIWGLGAVRYNIYLVRGRFLRTLGFLFVIGIAGAALNIAISPLRAILSVNIPLAFIMFMAEQIIFAFITTVTAFWYYDIKLHTEFPNHFKREDINENIGQ